MCIPLVITLAMGLVGFVVFSTGNIFPLWLSVASLVVTTIYLVQTYRMQRVGALVLLIWVVYALPFIHIPPYLFFDFNSKPLFLWGLAVNPYMIDEQIIRLTAMLGAVGGLGIAFAVSCLPGTVRRIESSPHLHRVHAVPTMALSIWSVWLFIGFSLSWLSAPSDTIFDSAYSESTSILATANFGSGWMMSYVILNFVFCDALLERNSWVRSIKRKLVLVAIAIIVFYFQFLRGDRESVPWVFGLALIYFYWLSNQTRHGERKLPWKVLAFSAFMLLLLSFILGTIRSSLTGVQLGDVAKLIVVLFEGGSLSFTNLLHGTWSAVLLTPLSVAGDYINNILDFKGGSDYSDLLLSIPPGFIADLVGYSRPIDGFSGPAWEMRYGIGGTHATVLPFINFGMAGVFLIPAIWTSFLVKIEKSALQRVSVVSISLLASVATASPHWLWYGEKSGMNAIIMWLVLSFFYRVSLGLPPYLQVSNERTARVSTS